MASRHGQVEIRKDLRIKQRPVEIPVGIVYFIAFAQRIEAILLAGMSLPGEEQGIQYRAILLQPAPTLIEKLQLVVNKTNVKRRIMDNDLGVPNKVDKIGRDVAKTRLVREELIADTVNVQSSWVDASIGLQILMKAALRQATVDNFPATNLNNPMALQRIEPSGFGV